jgi:hypothetical protein
MTTWNDSNPCFSARCDPGFACWCILPRLHADALNNIGLRFPLEDLPMKPRKVLAVVAGVSLIGLPRLRRC